MDKNPVDVQAAARKYLDDHNIEQIFADLITTITHYKCQQPLTYIVKIYINQIKYLCRTYFTPEQLLKEGIQLNRDDKIDQPIICLAYQDLTNHKGLIKKHLTRDVFYQCKNNQTTYGNNFRSILKLIKENPEASLGLYAVDPECYSTFEPLFSSFLAPSISYTKDYSFLPKTSILDDVRPMMDDCVIIMRRNINLKRFNSTMTPQARADLSKELLNVMKSQQVCTYNQVCLSDIGNLDFQKLNLTEKMMKKKDKSSMLINQLYTGSRYPDWPNNRYLLQTQDRSNICWINKEDHLKFKFGGNNFIDQVRKCITMNNFLEYHNSLCFTEKYGYQTVKPQYSGLGLNFNLKFKLDQAQVKVVKANLQAIGQKNPQLKSIFLIQVKESKYLHVNFQKSLGQTMSQLIEHLEQALIQLFQGIIQVRTPLQQKPAQVENTDYYTEHKQRLQLPRNHYPKQLIDIAKEIKIDGIYHLEEFVRSKFIIVRRNLQRINQPIEGLISLTEFQPLSDSETKDLLRNANLPYKDCLVYCHQGTNTSDYYLLLNYDDDFTWLFPFTEFSISQKIALIDDIIGNFSKSLKDQQFAFNADLGYLTNNNDYVGSGTSLLFQFIDLDDVPFIQTSVKIDIQGKFVILPNLSPNSYQPYLQAIIGILQKQKRQQQLFDDQICQLDCWKTLTEPWIPRFCCLSSPFEIEYIALLKKFGICLSDSVVGKYNNPIPLLKQTDGSINTDKLQITCTLSRNLKDHPYPHELSYQQKEQLTQYIAKQTTGLDVIINRVHHLQVKLQCNSKEFPRKYQELLQKLDHTKLNFQWVPNYGYIGPNINDSFLDGMQLEITTQKNINQNWCIQHQYEIHPMNGRWRLTSNRPCAFNLEIAFMQKLLEKDE